MNGGAGSADSGPAPIVLTATMGREDFAWADRLRRTHFPPERNHIPAHITLFHHLPPSVCGELSRLVARIAGERPPPPARLTEVMTLGRGVAYRIESPALLAVRDEIADALAPMLTAQDQGRPRLHITVQNKVVSAVAKALHAELAAGFTPRPFVIHGLALWWYRGGPWEMIAEKPFRGR